MSHKADTRTEHDSMGDIQVPARALWGAQTQRSLQHFHIGDDHFTPSFIQAFALVKKAAALCNRELGGLDAQRSELIVQVCDEILAGQHADQFPLSVWQTGSGTQTNMNVNEVIANRGNELAGKPRGSNRPLHPNDHVNRGQSSNDVFPTVMHVATLQYLQGSLLPAADALIAELDGKSREFSGLIKSGRTHMMDATPVTLGQEFGAYRAQVQYAREQLAQAASGVAQLAIGGSAVGTGLNTDVRWAGMMAGTLRELTGLPFESAADKFMALAGHDALVDLHGRLNRGGVAEAFGWTVAAGSYDEIVNDTLLAYGVTDIGDAADLAKLRALGNLALWQAAEEATVLEVSYTADNTTFNREAIFQHVAAMLAQARLDALPYDDGYQVDVYSVARHDPYSPIELTG